MLRPSFATAWCGSQVQNPTWVVVSQSCWLHHLFCAFLCKWWSSGKTYIHHILLTLLPQPHILWVCIQPMFFFLNCHHHIQNFISGLALCAVPSLFLNSVWCKFFIIWRSPGSNIQDALLQWKDSASFPAFPHSLARNVLARESSLFHCIACNQHMGLNRIKISEFQHPAFLQNSTNHVCLECISCFLSWVVKCQIQLENYRVNLHLWWAVQVASPTVNDFIFLSR